MNKSFSFSVALEHLKAGEKILNPRGDVLYLTEGKVMCIPSSQFPHGKRIETKIYWDAILLDDWNLFTGILNK